MNMYNYHRKIYLFESIHFSEKFLVTGGLSHEPFPLSISFFINQERQG